MNVLKRITIGLGSLVLVACGGGTTADGGSTAPSNELLQTTETAVMQGMMVARQNASYAVLGDVYTTKLDVVPVDTRNTVESVEVKNLNPQGAAPMLDAEGKLTWTPNQADFTGASALSVTIKPKVGDVFVNTLNIPIYQRRIALDLNVTGSGGTYADDSRHYIIRVTPSKPDFVLNGTVKVIELIDLKGRLVDRLIEDYGLVGVGDFEILSMPTLNPFDDVGIISTQADGYPLNPMPDNVGFLARLKPGDPNVKYGSYLNNGANVFSSRKSAIFRYVNSGVSTTFGVNKESISTRVFDYLSSCHNLTTGDLEACKELAGKKAPIVLIHGFNGFDNALTLGIDPKGGNRDTFSDLASLLKSSGHPVFEFQWHTYMRFEEAAGRINLFTSAIARELGYKPIVLAHSFGGIVSTMAVQGQGIEYIERSGWEAQPFGGQIAKLITFNSPLSGINDNMTGFVTDRHVAEKNSHDGKVNDFKMTRGRQLGDTSIGLCYSITCVQAGAHLADLPRGNLQALEFNAALIANVPDVVAAVNSDGVFRNGNYEWHKRRIWSGEAIHKLQAGVIPSTVKVLRFAGFRNLYPLFSKSGDGLISLAGQAAYPEHFVKNPYDETMKFEYRFIGDSEYELYNSFNPADWIVKSDVESPSSGPYLKIFSHSIQNTDGSKVFPRSPSFVLNRNENFGFPFFAGRDKRNFLAITSMSTRKKIRDLLPGECVKWGEADSSHVFPYIICARSSHTNNSRVDDLLDFSIANLGNEEAFIRHPMRKLIDDKEWVSAPPEIFGLDCNAENPPLICPRPSSIYTAKTALWGPSTSTPIFNTQSSAGVPALLYVTLTHKQTGAVKRDFAGAMSDSDGNWRYDVAAALRSRFGDAAKLEDYRMWVALVTLKYKPFHKTVEDLSPAGGDLGVFSLRPLVDAVCPSGQEIGSEGDCVATGLVPSLAINFDPASQFSLGAQNMQAVSFVAGHNGRYAAKFGGVANPGYIRIPNASTMQFVDGASLDLYARMDSMVGMDGFGRTVTDGGYAMTLLAKSHDRTGISFMATSMTKDNAKVWTAAFDPSMAGSCSNVPVPPVPLGTWVRVTYTMSSSTGIKAYLDKQLVYQCPTARPNFSTMNTRDLFIGKFSDTWYPLNGAIQDIRIYKKTLTAAEVASLN